MPASRTRRILAPAAVVGVAALLLGGATSATGAPAPADYTTIASQFGTAATAPWAATGTVSVVADATAGRDVVQLSVGASDQASLTHRFDSNTYPGIDNVLPSQLPVYNIFSGATNGQLDPATGLELQPSSTATVSVRSESGAAELFLDVEVAYGREGGAVNTVVLTCALPLSSVWTTVDLNDCSDLAQTVTNPYDAMNWMPTTDWTFNPGWGGDVTFPAGVYVKAGWAPEVMYGSAIGFRVVGDGTPADIRFDGLRVRGKSIAFLSDWPTAPTIPPTDSDLLQYVDDNTIPVEPISDTAVDPEADLPLDVDWSGQPGELVDVYAYSTPKLLGSFAATGGKVTTALSLAGLAPGAHHLLLVGRVSGTTQVYSLSVAQLLAVSGSTPAPTGVLGAAVLLLGAAALTVSAVRRRTSRA